MKKLAAFSSGLLFALGLGISGMTQPQKIIGFLSGFLNGFSNWDYSLIFVMVGAIAVHALTYGLIRKRKSPLLDVSFHVPNRTDITPQLVLGSAIFGIGWGLGGYCPGPAITSLASGNSSPWIFLISMIGGMYLHQLVKDRL